MRVLLVNYEYAPQSGGAGFMTRALARGLVQQGVKVDLLVGWDFSLGQPVADEGVNAFFVPVKRKSVHCSGGVAALSFIFKGARQIARLTRERRYDLIHYFFSVPSGFIQATVHGKIPYICSLRGIDVPFFMKNEFPALQLIALPFNYWILKKAAAVLSLSYELSRQLQRWFRSIQPQVIYNGLDTSHIPFKKERAAVARRFVCVSRLVKFKKLDLLIDAFSRICHDFPDATLDIFGDGYLRAELQERIERRGLSSVIKLCGYCVPETLREKILAYDVFVLPSVADSFGMVFIEAMAAGLPIIAADSGGPKEIVVHGQNGLLVKPHDVNALALAMRQFLEQEALCARMGRTAREHVETEFSLQKMVREHLSVYEHVIKT